MNEKPSTEAQSGYLNRPLRTEERAAADIARLRRRYAHVLKPWNELDLPSIADGTYTPPPCKLEPKT